MLLVELGQLQVHQARVETRPALLGLLVRDPERSRRGYGLRDQAHRLDPPAGLAGPAEQTQPERARAQQVFGARAGTFCGVHVLYAFHCLNIK